MTGAPKPTTGSHGAHTPPAPYTLNELVKCVEREIAMRQRVYPHRVADGKMKQKDADEEVAKMKAVIIALKTNDTHKLHELRKLAQPFAHACRDMEQLVDSVSKAISDTGGYTPWWTAVYVITSRVSARQWSDLRKFFEVPAS